FSDRRQQLLRRPRKRAIPPHPLDQLLRVREVRMTATRLLAACLLLALTHAHFIRAEPPSASTDQYGDPLPEGAIVRLGTMRFRHSGVRSVFWSEDDRRLISTSASISKEPFRVWDADTGTEIHRFGGSASTSALSSDGEILAEGWYDDS